MNEIKYNIFIGFFFVSLDWFGVKERSLSILHQLISSRCAQCQIEHKTEKNILVS